MEPKHGGDAADAIGPNGTGISRRSLMKGFGGFGMTLPLLAA